MVEHPEQAPPLFPRAKGADQFEVAAGGQVKVHVVLAAVEVQRVQALQPPLLGFAEIAQQGAERDLQLGLVREGKQLEVLRAELRGQDLGALPLCDGRKVEAAHHAAQALL